MAFLEMFSSLINMGSLWIKEPFMHLFLMIDGLIYRLISYSFKIFLMMCNINLDSLAGIVSGLVDRLKAVVMVYVLFKVGIALINALIDPNKAKDGTKIVKNIFIVAVCLISYQFVFSLLNEFGMLIMGNPTGQEYTVLSQIADVSATEDEGLIIRFVFGPDGIPEEGGTIGDYLAYKTLSMFVYDYGNPMSSVMLKNEIYVDGEYKFNNLPNLSKEVDKSVDYIWGLSGIVGIFLIYSIVKITIEIGVRMFKLVILQLIAPIAIISMVDDGWNTKTWKSYIGTYGKIYIEAFTRMLFMLITIVFVSKFFSNIGDFISGLNANNENANSIDTTLITILVIVAAFRIGNQIPKFITESLGKSYSGSTTNVLGSVLGAGLGAVGGLAAGITGGAGIAGSLGNMFAGGVGGFSAGAKGNGIADVFRNNSNIGKANRDRARAIAAAGGGLAYAAHGIENRLGVTASRQARANREADRLDRLKKYDTAISSAMDKDADGVAYGTDRDAYVNNKVNTDIAHSRYGSDRNAYVEKELRRQAEAKYEDNLRNVQSYREIAQTRLKNGAISEAEYKNAMLQASNSEKSIRQNIEREFNRLNAAGSVERTTAESDYDTGIDRIRVSNAATYESDFDDALESALSDINVDAARRDALASTRGMGYGAGSRRRDAIESGNVRGEIKSQSRASDIASHSGALNRENRQK